MSLRLEMVHHAVGNEYAHDMAEGVHVALKRLHLTQIQQDAMYDALINSYNRETRENERMIQHNERISNLLKTKGRYTEEQYAAELDKILYLEPDPEDMLASPKDIENARAYMTFHGLPTEFLDHVVVEESDEQLKKKYPHGVGMEEALKQRPGPVDTLAPMDTPVPMDTSGPMDTSTNSGQNQASPAKEAPAQAPQKKVISKSLLQHKEGLFSLDLEKMFADGYLMPEDLSGTAYYVPPDEPKNEDPFMGASAPSSLLTWPQGPGAEKLRPGPWAFAERPASATVDPIPSTAKPSVTVSTADLLSRGSASSKRDDMGWMPRGFFASGNKKAAAGQGNKDLAASTFRKPNVPASKLKRSQPMGYMDPESSSQQSAPAQQFPVPSLLNREKATPRSVADKVKQQLDAQAKKKSAAKDYFEDFPTSSAGRHMMDADGKRIMGSDGRATGDIPNPLPGFQTSAPASSGSGRGSGASGGDASLAAMALGPDVPYSQMLAARYNMPVGTSGYVPQPSPYGTYSTGSSSSAFAPAQQRPANTQSTGGNAASAFAPAGSGSGAGGSEGVTLGTPVGSSPPLAPAVGEPGLGPQGPKEGGDAGAGAGGAGKKGGKKGKGGGKGKGGKGKGKSGKGRGRK